MLTHRVKKPHSIDIHRQHFFICPRAKYRLPIESFKGVQIFIQVFYSVTNFICIVLVQKQNAIHIENLLIDLVQFTIINGNCTT